MPRPYRYDPFKQSARAKVAAAIRKGELTRPTTCGRCGEENKRIHAHHPDYNRPLEVLWYCPQCHRTVHPGVRNSNPIHIPKPRLAPRTGMGYVIRNFKEFMDKAESEGRATFIARDKTYEITLKWS